MPESFDTLLSEIAETAGSVVHPAGPAAARQRGHQRAVRRRVTGSVLSVVLVASAGGLAFALGINHSGVPGPITHSGTAVPTTPTTSVPASPSASAGSPSPSTSTSQSTPASVTGDLHTIVPGAWTPLSQFPFSGLNWKANQSQPGIHTADRQWFYTCYRPGTTLQHLGASGYQEMTYSAAAPSQASDAADQVMFFFPSTSAAQQALATIQHDYANCAEQTTGVNGVAMTPSLQQTEELDGSYAWLHTFRTANGGPGQPADIASDNHEYFVQRGDVVEMLWFGINSAVDAPGGDLSFLNSLNAGLCVYGGTCPASSHPLTDSIVSSSGSTSLALGGSPLEVGVTVTNNSHDTIRNITPIVSLGHCSCASTPVPMMPKGRLQFWSQETNSWKTVLYNAEGSGMDYALSPGAIQAPVFDLPAGESVSFNYRVQLSARSAQTVQLTNGDSTIDVTIVHPYLSDGPNVPIGISPGAMLPVTVTVN